VTLALPPNFCTLQVTTALDLSVIYGLQSGVIEVRTTPEYDRWFARLRDQKARQRIQIRIRRLSLGNSGDVKPVGQGVSELRIPYGPGYRVYFIQRKAIIILSGGDKSTQAADIRKAKEIAKEG
jgi:putative addiction module killer protein